MWNRLSKSPAPLKVDLSTMNQFDLRFEAVYDELKRLAAHFLRNLSPGGTLHATVLVHEVYLRLSGRTLGDDDPISIDQATFFAMASEAMRRIIIDYYRRKTCDKRGGRFSKIAMNPDSLADPNGQHDPLEIEEALTQFEAVYADQAEVVKLRFFVGMTVQQCAAVLNRSESKVKRQWQFARAWLADYLNNRSHP
jgi:RNA polymerase sigma factor (TIGR02999 family)